MRKPQTAPPHAHKSCLGLKHWYGWPELYITIYDHIFGGFRNTVYTPCTFMLQANPRNYVFQGMREPQTAPQPNKSD